MSEVKFKSVKPYALHVPDYSVETDSTGNKSQVELPGWVEVGFEVDGVKVPVERRKAAGLLADMAAQSKTTG